MCKWELKPWNKEKTEKRAECGATGKAGKAGKAAVTRRAASEQRMGGGKRNRSSLKLRKEGAPNQGD